MSDSFVEVGATHEVRHTSQRAVIVVRDGKHFFEAGFWLLSRHSKEVYTRFSWINCRNQTFTRFDLVDE
jgi:hypothetical protein